MVFPTIKENNKIMTLLTSKEQTILSLIACGLTTKQIAANLNMRFHTVESHRKNLLRKCEAKNAAELIQKTFVTI
jgi:DNA-binding NarL/FixJ family response regulator